MKLNLVENLLGALKKTIQLKRLSAVAIIASRCFAGLNVAFPGQQPLRELANPGYQIARAL